MVEKCNRIKSPDITIIAKSILSSKEGQKDLSREVCFLAMESVLRHFSQRRKDPAVLFQQNKDR